MSERAPWPASVLSKMKLSRFSSRVLQRTTAWRAAAIAAREGRSGSRIRAMASGSTTLDAPSKAIAAVSVLLPEPFGPATKVNVGTSGGVGWQVAQHDAVGFPR